MIYSIKYVHSYPCCLLHIYFQAVYKVHSDHDDSKRINVPSRINDMEAAEESKEYKVLLIKTNKQRRKHKQNLLYHYVDRDHDGQQTLDQ